MFTQGMIYLFPVLGFFFNLWVHNSPVIVLLTDELWPVGSIRSTGAALELPDLGRDNMAGRSVRAATRQPDNSLLVSSDSSC